MKPHRFDFNEETGNDQKTRELAHRAQLNKINNYSVRLTAAHSIRFPSFSIIEYIPHALLKFPVQGSDVRTLKKVVLLEIPIFTWFSNEWKINKIENCAAVACLTTQIQLFNFSVNLFSLPKGQQKTLHPPPRRAALSSNNLCLS